MESIQRLHASDLAYLWPELTIVIAAMLLTLLDLVMPRSVNRQSLGVLSLLSIVIATVLTAFQLNPDKAVLLLGGSYRIDDFASLAKLVLLASSALIVFMSLGSEEREGIAHTGEFYYLILPAVLGAMVMVSSSDMITLFVGLELLSITPYVLVGLRKRSSLSSEGAFKYIVMGGISSAFLLYGMSFLYGLTGSTLLTDINAALAEHLDAYGPLMYVSFFLLLVGFGFKTAAVPFHAWAPDVYQGAPTPISAFLAVVSKGAAVLLMFRFFYSTYYGIADPKTNPFENDIFLAVAVLAAISMVVGNAMALRQSNAKRLLALSGIANAGYLLVPIADQFGFVHYSNASELFYYLAAYALMNIGAFAVVMIVSQSEGHEELRGFAGLYHRAPWTAFAMVLLVLSLAGFPITAGFFGKLFIIVGSLQVQKLWLALIMIITSVVSFYYYFGVIRQMFMRPGNDNAAVKVPLPLGITAWLCAVGGIVLGAYPQGVLKYVESVFTLTQDIFGR